MPQFTDSKGDSWSIDITIGTMIRIKKALDVDLVQPLLGEPPLLTRLSTDLILLCNVLYVTCEPQASERGLTDVQFAERLGGDALQAASEAFWEGLTAFFRQLKRQDVVAAIGKQQEVIDRAVGLAEQTIDGDEFAALIDRELQKIPGSLSGDSPDRPASIPFPAPSES